MNLCCIMEKVFISAFVQNTKCVIKNEFGGEGMTFTKFDFPGNFLLFFWNVVAHIIISYLIFCIN